MLFVLINSALVIFNLKTLLLRNAEYQDHKYTYHNLFQENIYQKLFTVNESVQSQILRCVLPHTGPKNQPLTLCLFVKAVKMRIPQSKPPHTSRAAVNPFLELAL